MSARGSLRPSDAASGGFLDATIATIVSARFVDAYPNGTPSLLLEVTFQPEEGKARTELYRAGAVTEARPTADGSYYTPEDWRMRKDSNAMRLIVSLIDGGYDVSKLDIDIRVFAGTKVFLRRKATPGYTKKDGTVVKDGDILLVEKVLEMPSEGKKAAPAKVAKSNTAAKLTVTPSAKAASAVIAPVVAEGDITAELEAIITELLANAPSSTIALNRIGTDVFRVIMDTKNPNRAKLMVLSNKGKAFHGDDARPWVFDGENLIGAPSEAAA